MNRTLQPLAWRMQPSDMSGFIGQGHLLQEGKPLREAIEGDRIVSAIFYGPPGTGKTALAHIIAGRTKALFLQINAVTAGVREIREVIARAKHGRTTVFVDEIHRFNKIQQDALLPHVEAGEITLIGASTCNPSFALVSALLSRSLLFQFKPLTDAEVGLLINRALAHPKGLGDFRISIADDVIKFISSKAGGDARKALNILELSFITTPPDNDKQHEITREHVQEVVQHKTLYYDEDEHYNTISAFIKSMRGSDPDAAVYWLAKMLEAGEDPLYIARRIVICASEDVGNADPDALTLAVSAMAAVERIGLPEGRIPLSQAAIYVAAAPKSNASYLAIEKAGEEIREERLQEVPGHIKDSHYSGAARLGAGKGYIYPHAFEGHHVKQAYMNIQKTFYNPSDEGYEKVIKNILNSRRAKSNE